MAIDGVGIMESDLANDVHSEFFELYDSGVEVAEIRKRVSTWWSEVVDYIKREILHSVLCQALWEIGALESSDLESFRSFLEAGVSHRAWMDLDAPSALKRKKVLERQLARLSKPRRLPRKRRKYLKVTKFHFEVGDCLVYRFADGTRRGLVVGEILQNRGECTYYMFPVSNDAADPDDLSFFTEGSFPGHKVWAAAHPNGFEYGFHVTTPDHRLLIHFIDQFEKIGRIEINFENARVGSFGATMTKDVFEQDFDRILNEAKGGRATLFPIRSILI